MLRSMAAANATNAAASSVHVTCFTPTSTSGVLHRPSPPTVDDITNPLYTDSTHDLVPDSHAPLGVVAGKFLELESMVNFPPFLVLRVELARRTAGPPVASGRSSKRWPRPSGSRHASSLPHGFQVPSSGRRISQAPGFDRLTRPEPGEGTKGFVIEAAATGQPERSWMVIDHPLRSFESSSLELNQLLDVLASEIDDLKTKR